MSTPCRLLENCVLLIIAVALNRFVSATFPSRGKGSFLEHELAALLRMNIKIHELQKNVATFLHGERISLSKPCCYVACMVDGICTNIPDARFVISKSLPYYIYSI